MSKKITTYYFGTPQVQKKTLVKPTDVNNLALIELRKTHLAITATNPHLKESLRKLNEQVRKKPLKSLVNVVNYWLSID